ncbi:hypothetical protein BGZ51_004006 [Haplosporangium sp. Z 767]|nr:hypothetical protein BGZ51_004006 [Haplosporangium sp. Z 767]
MAYWGAEPEIDLEMADKIESVSLAWSPKISMDDIGSVLALGNKAGDITFWHVTDPDNVRCVKSWKPSGNNWIVRMSWSPWIVEGDQYISMLAYATADGAICVSRVKFSSSRPLDDIDISENIMDTSHQTLHPCTVLRWSQTTTENANKPNVLAFSRGNRLNIWLPESNKTFVWRKPMAKAISDISWDTFGKKVFVFFMDGKHSILCLEDDGLIADDEYVDFVYQSIISRCHMQSKSNISQDDGDIENANAEDDGDEDAGGSMANSKLQLHIISGNRSAEGLQLATVYFVTCPFLMEFQRERYQSCTLVLSNAHKDMRGETTETLFSRLETFIHLPRAFITRNPAYHLYDILMLLGGIVSVDGGDPEPLRKLFQVLNAPVNPIQDNTQALAKREAMQGLPTSLESRMEHAIFNSTTINADRVSIYLWSQLQKCTISLNFKRQLEEHSTAAVTRIKRHGVRSILELFIDVATSTPSLQPSPVTDLKSMRE